MGADVWEVPVFPEGPAEMLFEGFAEGILQIVAPELLCHSADRQARVARIAQASASPALLLVALR